jgi:hypothetical protein
MDRFPKAGQEILHQEYYNWSQKKLLVFGARCCCRRQGDDDELYRNPPPIMKLSMDELRFDCLTNKLVIGQNAWTELAVKNTLPYALGTANPIVCPANDAGTIIFYCGGRVTPRYGKENHPWLTLTRKDTNPFTTYGTALFDVETSTWKALPRMSHGPPSSGRGLAGSGACRIQSKIYVVGGYYELGRRWTFAE